VNFLNDFVNLNSLNLVLGLDNIGQCIRSGEGPMLDLMKSLTVKTGRILAFPELGKNGYMLGVKDMLVDDSMNVLLSFLQKTGRLSDLSIENLDILRIKSDHIIELLSHNNESWHEMVPAEIVPILQENRNFLVQKKVI
jgi:hypothetical protein